MGRKTEFIADEAAWKKVSKVLKEILKPCSVPQRSKFEDRKGDRIFCVGLGLTKNEQGIVSTTHGKIIIENDGQRKKVIWIPIVVSSVNSSSKELLKESVCELIDSIFKVYDENKI